MGHIFTNREETSHPGHTHPQGSENSHPEIYTYNQIRNLSSWETSTQTDQRTHNLRHTQTAQIPPPCAFSHEQRPQTLQQTATSMPGTPYIWDIPPQTTQEPSILGYTPRNSSEGSHPGSQIPPTLKINNINIWTQTLKRHRDVTSRDSVAQTALISNTLDADSGHLRDISSWDLQIHTPQRTNQTWTGPSKEFMAVKPETQTPKHLNTLTPRTPTARDSPTPKTGPKDKAS